MSGYQQPRPLACGHIRAPEGVCQYREDADADPCGRVVCKACYVKCDRGGDGLCREHQFMTSDQQVFCRDHYMSNWLRSLLERFLFGGGTDGF